MEESNGSDFSSKAIVVTGGGRGSDLCFEQAKDDVEVRNGSA